VRNAAANRQIDNSFMKTLLGLISVHSKPGPKNCDWFGLERWTVFRLSLPDTLASSLPPALGASSLPEAISNVSIGVGN
jgi:hypothetical protein